MVLSRCFSTGEKPFPATLNLDLGRPPCSSGLKSSPSKKGRATQEEIHGCSWSLPAMIFDNWVIGYPAFERLFAGSWPTSEKIIHQVNHVYNVNLPITVDVCFA